MTNGGEITKRLYFQAKTLSLGMAAAVFVYGILAYYLIHIGKSGPKVLGPQEYRVLQYGLLIFSVAGNVMMYRLRERILNPAQRELGMPPPEVPRPPQKLFIATVLMMAAAEMPVLFGLILVFLGSDFYVFLPFGALSLAGFYFAFPRKQQWEDWLGASF